MSEKRKKILAWFNDHQQLTKKQAVNLIGGSYYHNRDKHTGEVLTRMIKAKILVRVKRGVYEIAKQQTPLAAINQLSLF